MFEIFKNIYDQVFDINNYLFLHPCAPRIFSNNIYSLNVDIKETKDHYIINADIPGVNKDDIKIEFCEDLINISANKNNLFEEKDKETDKETEYYISEIKYGFFSKSIKLPDDFNKNDMETSYVNGVLTLKIKKILKCEKINM